MGKLQSNNCNGEGSRALARGGVRIGLEAPVQYLEHLALDGGEQGHVDVENAAQLLLELRGGQVARLSVWRVFGAHSWGGAAGGGQVERKEWRRERMRGATCNRLSSPSRDVLDAMTHAPSSIGRIEFTRTVVGCSTSVGHGQLADRHAETLDEEQDVLVHLVCRFRVGWGGGRGCRLGGRWCWLG